MITLTDLLWYGIIISVDRTDDSCGSDAVRMKFITVKERRNNVSAEKFYFLQVSATEVGKMEFFMITAVIIALCILLGVSTELMILGALAFISLVILAMFLLFVFFFIILIGSRKTEAVFTKTDKRPNGKFNVAFYLIDGKEYPCVFPSEPNFKNLVYKEGKSYRVMLNKRTGAVFDKWAVTTCVLGLIFSSLSAAAAVMIIFQLINQ